MHAPRGLRILVISALLAGVVGPMASSGHASPYRTESPDRLPAPALIEQAVRAGQLDRDTANLYIAYSMLRPHDLPAAYRSSAPFHATVWLHQLRRELPGMRPGPARSELESLLAPDPGSFCDVLSPSPLPDNVQTDHFYIEYDATLIGGASGLTLADYIDSLEHSWQMEVSSFGWAAPPLYEVSPPGGTYHVRIEPTMAPVLYGFVSNLGKYAGPVGDNPNSAWDDVDADASCMGLNNDYSNFPGSPRRALDATTAHEFNHSLQFGIGGLSGANTPESVFIEGGATYMEDEAYDTSNDNYNYLWPLFEDDMGENEDFPYSYWVVWRAIFERFGTAVPGGGEDVYQAFWEITSRNEGSNLEALRMALAAEGTSLADAYSTGGVALKFLRACAGRYKYPYCLEEGPQYVNGDGVQQGAGETEPHGEIAGVGGSFSGTVPDNYALNWVTLPTGAGTYSVRFTNTSTGGNFKVILACDSGTALKVVAMPGTFGAGKTSAKKFSSSGCLSAAATIANVAQTAPNPSTSEARGYTISVS
jgi:hypothetical protein